MADYKISIGAELRTKDIDTAIKNYKGKVNVGVTLDKSAIDSEIRNYKPIIQVESKLNTKGITDGITNFGGKKNRRAIKVSIDPDFTGVETAIKGHTVNTPLKVKVELNWAGVAGEIGKFTTAEKIKLDAELNDTAISTAINGYQAKTPIKISVDPDFSEASKKISTYQMRNMLKVNVKLNKTSIDSQIKNFQTSKYIEVGAKLKDNAIESAISKHATKELVPVSVDFKVGNTNDVDQRISIYKNTPVEIPVKLRPATKNFDSLVTKTPIQVEAELSPEAINKAIANPPKTLSKIPIDVKLSPKDINAQIKGLKTSATEPLDVNVRLNKDSINDDIALFQPTATLGVKPDLILENVDEQISAYVPKTQVRVNAQLNDIIETGSPVRLDIELNPEGIQRIRSQVDDLRQQIQDVANIRINLGGNNNGSGSGGRGGRRQVDEATQAYRELMGVLNELNSKRIQLNGLDATSSESSSKIQTLRLQIEQLDYQFNNLLNSFNAQGIQFTADQWNQLETVLERVGRRIDVVQAGMSDKTAIQSQTQAYKELLSISKEIGSLEINITKLRNKGGNANQIEVLENQLRTLQSTYQQLVTTMNTPLTADQWGSIYTQVAKTSEELSKLQAKYVDTREQMAKGISDNFGNYDADFISLNNRFNELADKPDEVRIALSSLKEALASLKDADGAENIIAKYEKYENAVKQVTNQIKTLELAEDGSNKQMRFAAEKEAAMRKLNSLFGDGSAAARKYSGEVERLRNELNSCGNIDGVRNVNKQINALGNEIKRTNIQTQSFGERIKGQFAKYSSYFSVASVFMYAAQGLRDMFKQVVAVDTAMTELKKVTNETDASYNQFLSNAASRSKELGTTVDGLVQSTADFARLGYSFEQSQGLAEVANIYAVVGDEIEGVEDATQSLISTMAAFKDEMGDMSDSEFALSIVDKMNEVANNYAISSGGIGQALQRSASSMAAANNTVDETIALITAANEVAQDPEKVGNAMKTKFLYNCLNVQKCA